MKLQQITDKSGENQPPLPRVQVTGVHKSFGGRNGKVRAVQGIDLTINAGEIVAFLGPNGAGKTTTIDMLLGLTTPDKGIITVMGKSPAQAVNSGLVSAVMQTGGLLRDLTVKETVTAIASLHGCQERIDGVIKRAKLESIQARRVSKCSGGEQQRLRFALALLPDPDLIILDEPTAGMDVTARREFWSAMQEDADSGRTIIFATHYLEEAESFAERTILIKHGKIVADGTTSHIRAVASGRFVTATMPHPSEEVLTRIASEPGVQGAELFGTRLHVSTTDSDGLARRLLGHYGAMDLEISAPSLESAFMNLTAEDEK